MIKIEETSTIEEMAKDTFFSRRKPLIVNSIIVVACLTFIIFEIVLFFKAPVFDYRFFLLLISCALFAAVIVSAGITIYRCFPKGYAKFFRKRNPDAKELHSLINIDTNQICFEQTLNGNCKRNIQYPVTDVKKIIIKNSRLFMYFKDSAVLSIDNKSLENFDVVFEIFQKELIFDKRGK